MTTRKCSPFAVILTATLLTCEKVPDYCGKGAWYDPNVQFCFSGKAYNQCANSGYNPLTEGCIQGVEVGTLCSNGSVVKLGTPCGGYILTAAATPEFGGSVTHTPADRTTFAAGEQVVVSAVPEDKYKFVGWAGTETPPNPSVTIIMNANKPMVAMFQPIDDPNAATRALITTAFPENGGTIARNPHTEMYTPGTKVTATATAARGYKFSGWSGAETSANASVTVTLDESKTLVAMFTPAACKLTVNANPPEGGSVFVNGTALAGTATQDIGTVVDIEAKAADGYVFTGWSGTAVFGNAGSAKTKVTPEGDVAIMANFRTMGGGETVTPPGVTPPVVTPPEVVHGSVTDVRDGQTYRTVKIGDQTWMAENLNYNTRDGVGSWCYEDSPDSCAKCGRLYDWATAMDIDVSYNKEYWGGSDVKHQGVCPAGWHLSSMLEWYILIVAVGGGNIADKKLKSTSGWGKFDGVSGDGTDDYGFSALPCGRRSTFGGDFRGAGDCCGNWWSTTEFPLSAPFLEMTKWYSYPVNESQDNKAHGFSVRCVEGAPTVTQTYTLTVEVSGYTFEMVPVAGGTFTMGCTSEQGNECEDNESPTHSVTLSSYYIGQYEVTQGLWKAVMGSSNNPSYFKGDSLPVESVSWNDIAGTNGFIQKLNQSTGKTFRLPTEAEWEYAARGGKDSRGYKYSGGYIGIVAWYAVNSGSTTHTVGGKAPNELGIYDMSGNVWEWVSDWYSDSYYSSSTQTDPTGPATGSYRVLRGGSWDYGARGCRVSRRSDGGPDDSGGNVGFRLVLLSP